MAVHQIGPKGFQKTPGTNQADDDAPWRLEDVEIKNIETRGPLFRLTRAQNDKSNRVSPRCHPLGQGNRLTLRSAHAKRCEHVYDAHDP